jgi:sugar lactone lactonase YvrE
MNHKSVLCGAALLVLAALPSRLSAVDTHIWEHSDESDFNRGTVKKLSIRSDGHLMLAPQLTELDSTTVPYLWALAQDSKGTLYYAGGAPTGNTTKVYALTPGGKPKEFASLTGLEVHALAVDSQNRVYAAVLPDAKIYRIDAQGKPELFFDAKSKYIWALDFDKSGNLFVATGDEGIIYKVTPDGKGSKFFSTGETHARSMTFDASGNLIVGTEPSGLIIRITPAGEGFVLFQANKREVTAVAVNNGFIYATAVGNKTGGLTVTGPAPVLPAAAPAVSGAGTARTGNQPPTLPPAIGSLSASVSGGTELYRVEASGQAERIWTSANDIAYAIAFDADSKPLIGTGNHGVIVRIDSDQYYTEILKTPPTQVTAFLKAANGTIYAATGNVGNVYAIGPGTEASGTLESEALDAGEFAQWGKVHITSSLNGGTTTFETRSGNLNHPESLWSPWTKVDVAELGGAIHSPNARFLQYRLTLSKSSSGQSPEVSLIDIAYLPKNIAPRVTQIEMAPANYKQAASSTSLERNVMPSGSPLSLSLPAVGQKRSSSTLSTTDAGSSSTLTYAKGYITARWAASDANNDPLQFKIEIKGKSDTIWLPLKDKLQDHYYAFDSAAFPDGSYQVRVTASDAPGNTPADTLTSSLVSDTFLVDNTPPEITAATVIKQSIHFTAKDALSWIDKAEYSINGGEWTQLDPVNKVTDSQTLDYELTAQSGQLVSVRVFDEYDNVVVKQFPVN